MMAVEELEALARHQLGLFTSRQARACGVAPNVVHHHTTRSGRGERLYPRVFRVATLPAPRAQADLAALVWAGDDGVLGHRAAARLHDLDGPFGTTPEVWTRRWPPPEGLVVHSGRVSGAEVVGRGLLRLTTIRRTVFDLAAVLDADELELVVESALRKDRTLDLTPPPGLRGARTLRTVLARRPPGCSPTDSELETRYLQLIRNTTDLPDPVRQHPVINDRGIRIAQIDVAWPALGLWVELDSRRFHGAGAALFVDRHRQNEVLDTVGGTLRRFMWSDVVDHPSIARQQTERAYAACTQWPGRAAS
jgi:hypothetical protein